MNQSLKNVKLIFLIIIICVTVLSYYSFRQIKSLIDTTKIVNHTHQVKFELEKEILLLSDAETGQRGYLLTSDSIFLEPYNSSFQQVEHVLRNLDELTKSNPGQKNNTAIMHGLVDQRLTYLKSLVGKLNDKTKISAADLLEGKRLMDMARVHAANMMAEEDKNLQLRLSRLATETKLTPLANIGLVCVALFILIIAYFKILNELKASRILQESLQVSEASLKLAINELERNKAQQIEFKAAKRFELIANTMPQFIWTSDAQGHFNYFSQSVYDATGCTPEQLCGDNLGWLQIIHPDDRNENISKWTSSVKTGQPFLLEHRFIMANGEYRWQLSRAVPQKDGDGNVQMWVGTSTDIQAQKMFLEELEKQVDQRTAELKKANSVLEKANEELNQFAYIASHDLQEPLRKIQTFISRLVDTETNLTDKGKDYFARISKSSRQMQQLILDILTYSRTSNPDSKLELTDANQVLNSVIDHLSDTIEQSNATITVATLPVVYAIRYQLEQLFLNLVSNAIKFSRSGVAPALSIACGKVNGRFISHRAANPSIMYHYISFADNGIGFDQQFGDRIFGVFQRLHSKEQYEGTGIGLAIVKKIADNHHGLITATSQVNHGATFTVYLPEELGVSQ